MRLHLFVTNTKEHVMFNAILPQPAMFIVSVVVRQTAEVSFLLHGLTHLCLLAHHSNSLTLSLTQAQCNIASTCQFHCVCCFRSDSRDHLPSAQSHSPLLARSPHSLTHSLAHSLDLPLFDFLTVCSIIIRYVRFRLAPYLCTSTFSCHSVCDN